MLSIQPVRGHWTVIGHGVKFADCAKLGDWTSIGDRSVIGSNCHFGSHSAVGRDVTLGDNVHLGSHTAVHDGCTVPAGTRLGDFQAFTAEGVKDDAFGPWMTSMCESYALIYGVFGHFLVPGDYRHSHREIDDLLEDYRYGRSNVLELLRIPKLLQEDELLEAAREVVDRLDTAASPSLQYL